LLLLVRAVVKQAESQHLYFCTSKGVCVCLRAELGNVQYSQSVSI
jgi:hypothetical protein